MAVWEKIKKNKIGSSLRIDPEYYQPYYLELERKLFSFCKNKISDFSNLSENIFHAENIQSFNYIEIAGINTKSGEILFNEVNITDTPSRAKYLMNGNEILVSTVRPNRSAIGLIPLSYKNFVASSGFAPLIPKFKKYRAFIFIWLKTKIITEWLIRNTTASMYPAVSSQDILNCPIFEPSNRLLIFLMNNIEVIEKLLFNSSKLLPEAEQELLARLEWNKFDSSYVLNYSATSEDVNSNYRLDPEFYQPKFLNLQKFLNKKGSRILGSFCPTPGRGITPLYIEGNALIVNSQNLMSNGLIDFENLEPTSISFYNQPENTKAMLEKFDVLTYATGAYIGRTNCWLESVRAIAGIDCLIIRPNKNVCNPVYLALFLNSKPGLMQSEQRASGSAQRHLYPNDLMQYIIYIPTNKNGKPDLEWQNKLAAKVEQAYTAKREAKQKLNKAINLIESEIEKLINKSV